MGTAVDFPILLREDAFLIVIFDFIPCAVHQSSLELAGSSSLPCHIVKIAKERGNRPGSTTTQKFERVGSFWPYFLFLSSTRRLKSITTGRGNVSVPREESLLHSGKTVRPEREKEMNIRDVGVSTRLFPSFIAFLNTPNFCCFVTFRASINCSRFLSEISLISVA